MKLPENLGLKIVTGAFGLVVFAIVFVIADACGTTSRTNNATVIERDYTPESFSTFSGADNSTQLVHSPAQYRVYIQFNGHIGSTTTSPGTYERITNGQPVQIRYRFGRFSNYLYIWSAQFQ